MENRFKSMFAKGLETNGATTSEAKPLLNLGFNTQPSTSNVPPSSIAAGISQLGSKPKNSNNILVLPENASHAGLEHNIPANGKQGISSLGGNKFWLIGGVLLFFLVLVALVVYFVIIRSRKSQSKTMTMKDGSELMRSDTKSKHKSFFSQEKSPKKIDAPSINKNLHSKIQESPMQSKEKNSFSQIEANVIDTTE